MLCCIITLKDKTGKLWKSHLSLSLSLSLSLFARNMFHPDAVPLLEIQHDHVGTSLVSCFIISHQFNLWHAVQYDVYLEILLAVLEGADVEDIGTSHRGREDSCTRVVSCTDIQDNTIENQSPAIPSWAKRCYSSCKGHLLFWICKQQKKDHYDTLYQHLRCCLIYCIVTVEKTGLFRDMRAAISSLFIEVLPLRSYFV